MATTKLFNLPPIPPALKSVTPYLQRADELKGKEPIMSYWCTYYAAQVGIALNVKETSSRVFLFDLLGLLESMKEAIGPNDAIDVEAASAAYVENFAVKVFSMADNEDRKGAATRHVDSKFLAAAHFLDVLKTFRRASSPNRFHDEKIRYAKWKAADIGKAFREGRKPTPGPANAEPELDPETLPPHLH
ncbi:hypothetical protein BDZ89DRAFT_944490 [Hymenopellis radicata]|nr:hypothetical protein BDZ89DRAFT_944490 [Hymenopellis radicata]